MDAAAADGSDSEFDENAFEFDEKKRSSVATRPLSAEETVAAFYAQVDPSKNVPLLLAKYEGRVDKLLDRIAQKYGAEALKLYASGAGAGAGAGAGGGADADAGAGAPGLQSDATLGAYRSFFACADETGNDAKRAARKAKKARKAQAKAKAVRAAAEAEAEASAARVKAAREAIAAAAEAAALEEAEAAAAAEKQLKEARLARAANAAAAAAQTVEESEPLPEQTVEESEWY